VAVSTEILRSWRAPRRAMRRQLAAATEARALAYLIAGCGLVFVAQWPRLAREAHVAPEVPLDARIGGALIGWLGLAPLLLYGLAALSHLAARALGGRGSWLGARMALAWSLLAAAPLVLLQGLVAGFLGPGPALTLTGGVLAAAFLGHWALALVEAEAG
jgi:hypothetical protein